MKVTAPLSRLKTSAVRIGIYLPVGVMARLQAELTGLNRERVERLIDDLIDRGARRLGASEDADRPPTSDSSPTGNKTQQIGDRCYAWGASSTEDSISSICVSP